MSGAPLDYRAADAAAQLPLDRQAGLLGFVSVEFLDIGLQMFDLPVFASGLDGQPWVALPRKPKLDREHRQRLDVNQKLEFEPIAGWADREAGNRFGSAVLALIRRTHPGVLDRGDA